MTATSKIQVMSHNISVVAKNATTAPYIHIL